MNDCATPKSIPVAEREHIHVRVPCGFFVSAGVSAFMCLLERLNSEPTCPYRFTTGFIGNFKPADFARNVIVEDFLKDSTASRLWFIDSDMIPAPNALQLLWHRDHDIVAAPYPLWGRLKGQADPCAAWTIYDLSPEQKGVFIQRSHVAHEGFKRHDGAGTGMMLIKRRVLADSRMILPENTFLKMDRTIASPDDGEARPFFRNYYRANGAMESTEDLEFCFRAKALGYDLIIDHGVKCGHVKTLDVLDVMNFATRSYMKGWVEHEASINAANPFSLITPFGEKVASSHIDKRLEVEN